MIRVTLTTPNEPDKKFDWDYYLGTHIPLVHAELDHRGLVRVEIDKGISAADPSAPAPALAALHLIFNTVEEVHTAFIAAGRPLMGDIPNYTDIKPTVQISEMVG